MTRKVAIIGGGVAGLETAHQLIKLGYKVSVFEKDSQVGGHVAMWDRLFPNRRHANEVIGSLSASLGSNSTLHLSNEVRSVEKMNGSFLLKTGNIEEVFDALVIATGFELFSAEKKEEYGYGIFENVITSADLEKMFATSGKPIMTDGKTPSKIAFIHCVGSRDEKVNRPYCSKVCCVTAVKQAIEAKEAIPDADVFCFYMDLRMFGPGYEELYKEAQVKGINFIRGRLSESSELDGGRVLIKAEDTLSMKPLKMSVDMVVLMVGMSPSKSTKELFGTIGLELNNDEFIQVTDYHLHPTLTNVKGVFVAGACTGPNNITDSINAARSAAVEVHNYLKVI